MNKEQLQQGDVTLERIASVPPGTMRAKRSTRGYILMEGEQTGHAHVITDEELDIREGEDGTLYLSISRGQSVQVRHEEHATVEIPAGTWKVGRVREFDYLQQMERPVQD